MLLSYFKLSCMRYLQVVGSILQRSRRLIVGDCIGPIGLPVDNGRVDTGGRIKRCASVARTRVDWL
jgi:hypothetical protein